MDNYNTVEEKDKNFEFLRKHNLCAREHDPKFSPEIKHMLSPFYADIIAPEDSLASPRVLRLLRNLCYAIARLKLKDTVDEEDVIEAMKIYKKQLEYVDQVVNISKKPLEYVREKVIEALDGLPFEYKLEKLVESVRKTDVFARGIIGENLHTDQ